MLRSLYSGVAGLTAHQSKMDVIGNNIANVNTYGFKGSRVTFRDIYYQTTKTATGGDDTTGGINPSQVGYGVSVGSVDKIMSRSSFQSSSSTLDVAIAGEGFIQVQDKSGNKYYTRAGMLNVDNSGNLIDSNGKFVLGAQNGDPTIAEGLSTNASNSKINIKVPNVHIAKVTKTLDATASGVTGFTSSSITIGFLNGNQTSDIKVTINDAGAGAKDSIDATTDMAATPPSIVINLGDAGKITNVEDLAARINTMIENEKTRELDASKVPADVREISDENFKGGKISIKLDMGTGKLDDGSRDLTSTEIKTLKANAVKALVGTANAQTMVSSAKAQSFGDLSSFYISENGTLIGMHAVHGALTFGRIDLATFDNPGGLQESGNSYFQSTTASGDPKLATPGFEGSGALVSSALEMSNVNLAQEFSDMITTQRGFQANSRIITTSDSMLEELVNLKR